MALTDYNIDTSGSPQDVQRKQKLADALMKQGSDSSPAAGGPNGGVITALNRGLAGALAGYQSAQADQRDQANKQAEQALLSSYPGMSTASPIAAALSGGTPAASADTAPNKIYSNDEPSPLDPPSGDDRKKMLATILGEESTAPGQAGVANVIRNRAVDGSYGGNTPSAVVQSPNQFEPWNTPEGRARMATALQNPAQVAQADNAIKQAYGEGGKAPDDPTEGKTMFYAPQAQAALGRPAPAWAQGPGQMLGKTAFFDDNSDTPAAAQPTQGQGGPAAQTPQSPQVDPQAQHRQELQAWARQAALSPNPSIRQMAITTLEQLNKPSTVQTLGEGYIYKDGKVVKAYEPDDSPKWGIIGKDKYGQPTYGYPPSREEAKAKAAAPTQTAADQPDLTDVHGEDYMGNLKKSDPKMESQVRAIIEGRAPYPTGMLLKTPYGQELASHVTQADPSFEAGNATARVKIRNEFMSGGVGSPAGQISAGNTALQHAGEMSDALERMKTPDGSFETLNKLGEDNIPYVSYYANKLHNAGVQGTPGGKDLNDFMTAKNHFSEEVTKFYAGSAGSEAERARALANLDAAKSLPELRSAIKTEANLMQGKVNALQERWRNGMGPLVPDFPLISKESQGAVGRIMQRDQSSAAPQAQGVDPGAIAEAKRRGLIP